MKPIVKPENNSPNLVLGLIISFSLIAILLGLYLVAKVGLPVL